MLSPVFFEQGDHDIQCSPSFLWYHIDVSLSSYHLLGCVCHSDVFVIPNVVRNLTFW
jgi:hypothetical protein